MTTPLPIVLLNGLRYIDSVGVCRACLAEQCECPQVGPAPMYETVFVNGGLCILFGPDQAPLCFVCRLEVGGCSQTGGVARCEDGK